MSSLIKNESKFQLTPSRLAEALDAIRERIKGRVSSAYVFGSAATSDITADSDIDLIFVVDNPKAPFVQRGFEFLDLFEIYPKLDILVYTKQELDDQLANSAIGFWRSVRLSMRKLL